MPQTKSHIKNQKIILRNRLRNKKYKVAVKKAIKNHIANIQNTLNPNNEKNSVSCTKSLSLVYRAIDKAVKKKVLHKNTASRKKSKLSKLSL